jgi:hypothetical protein
MNNWSADGATRGTTAPRLDFRCSEARQIESSGRGKCAHRSIDGLAGVVQTRQAAASKSSSTADLEQWASMQFNSPGEPDAEDPFRLWSRCYRQGA